MEEKERIDLQSEAVRDYLQKTPNGIIRWGSGVISTIVLIFFALTCLIKYPSLIHADFKLTTQVEPKSIIARIDGRLEKLTVKNHEFVFPNQVVAFLESTAKHEEVLQLDSDLIVLRKRLEKNGFDNFNTLALAPYEHLGDVQATYQLFRQEFSQLYLLLGRAHYKKGIELLKRDIAELEMTNSHLKSQYSIHERDANLAENDFKVNQKLFAAKVISQLDLNREESKMLAKRIPLKSIETTILNNNAQIRLKEKGIMELDRQVTEETENFLQSLNTLSSSIAAWKNRYVLMSASKGELVYANNLQEKMNVKSGFELCLVFESDSRYIGTLTIPQENLGKVKVGQKVLIKFQSFPFQEYGIVEGNILTPPQISTQDDDKSFFSLVELSNGLRTSHNKILTPKYGMNASAEIVTEDLRLSERIFYSIRKIFN